MVEAGFEGIGTYITRSQNMVAQYISTRPIMDLCEQSAWRPGSRVSCQWWKQDGLYFEGGKKRSAAAAESYRENTIGKEEGIPQETTTVRELGRGYKVATYHNRETESGDLVASVMVWNSTTQ